MWCVVCLSARYKALYYKFSAESRPTSKPNPTVTTCGVRHIGRAAGGLGRHISVKSDQREIPCCCSG